jgi:uncharacterized protein YdeI (YjbR/CyaY-like superfamily)
MYLVFYYGPSYTLNSPALWTIDLLFSSILSYTCVMKSSEDLPTLGFATQQDWELWLAEHHAEPTGIWLKIAKKGNKTPSISYAEAVEGALCYGWIDGQAAAFDGQYWLQKFTPRRAKSIWSQINCDKAHALIEAGRMQAAGLRQVELAQADGRWESAYVGQSKATVPDDLQLELDKNPQARDFFLTLNSANRYSILFRVQSAKKPETRAARIQKFVGMLANGEKLYP